MRTVAVALLLLAVACGYKSSPVAPEFVKPSAPPALRAVSTASGIELRWRRPARYTSGRRMRDLGGFEISRVRGDDPLVEFEDVKRIELDDQLRFRPETEFKWLDTDVAPGERYRYRVVAFTLDGYHSKPATAQKKWNPGVVKAAKKADDADVDDDADADDDADVGDDAGAADDADVDDDASAPDVPVDADDAATTRDTSPDGDADADDDLAPRSR